MNITSILSFGLPEGGTGGYRWGEHHRRYIAWSAGRCPLSLEDLAGTCGYRKLQKFDRRRRQWNEGKGRIPLRYLEAIGVDLALLGDCVALDQREHEVALREARFPRFFVARAAAAVYMRVELPEGTPEVEAIRLVKEYASATGRSCLLTYPGLLTVAVSPEGRVAIDASPPEVEVRCGTVSFGEPAGGAGIMRPR